MMDGQGSEMGKVCRGGAWRPGAHSRRKWIGARVPACCCSKGFPEEGEIGGVNWWALWGTVVRVRLLGW